MRRIQLAIAVALVFVVCGCIASSEPPRFGTAHTAVASTYGVSELSPVANAVLALVCDETPSCLMTPYDASTGDAIADVPSIALGAYNLHAISPDGSVLATVSYPDWEHVNAGTLFLTDLESWTTVTATVPVSNVLAEPVFSPDGSRIALLRRRISSPSGQVLTILELLRKESGANGRSLDARLLAETAPLPLNPVMYTYSSDGSRLHLYGSDTLSLNMSFNPKTLVAAVDADSLDVLWSRTLATVLDGQQLSEAEEESADPRFWDPHIGVWWQPARVFSHDGNELYLVHANEERMTTVDFAAERIVARAIEQRMGMLERLLTWWSKPAYAKILNGVQLEAALNYDGSQILVTGIERDYTNNVYNEAFLPLRIIDAATGRLLATGADGTITESSDVDLRIFLNHYDTNTGNPMTSNRTLVVSPSTGEVMEEINQWTVIPARRLDGAAILLGMRHAANAWGSELAILDSVTFGPTLLDVDSSSGWGSFVTQ